MTAALFTAVLWLGLAAMRVPGRWALAGFDIALFGLAAVVLVRRRGAVGAHPIGWLLAAAAAWGAIQAGLGLTVDHQLTWEAVLGWTANCAAFSVAREVTAEAAAERRFLVSQLLFALAVSVTAVVIFFINGTLGPFVYRNQFAAYIESVLGVAIAFAILNRRRWVMWTLIAAALFAAVVAGGSRAGSILCLAEMIVIPLVAFARGWLPGRTLLRVGALAAVAGGVLVAVVGWERILLRFEEPRPYSLRADLLRSSVAMARDRPLSGFGLGAWSTAYPAYARFDDGDFVNQAHNDWAQWAAEGGLPMLAIMAAVVGLLARPALDSLWGLGLIAVFLHAWVDYPFEQRPALAAFLFATAGVLSATSSPTAGPRRGPFPAPAPSGSSPPEG